MNGSDGLSAKNVKCLYKDAAGYLWIGTSNGLNRFDGNLIKRYDGIKGEKDINVTAIFPIDKEDRLLVGTTRGLLVFNKRSGSFQEDARFAGLRRRQMLSIKADGQKRLWLITNSELFIFHDNRVSRAEKFIPEIKKLLKQNLFYTAPSAFAWDALRKGFWVGGSESFFIDCQHSRVYDEQFNPFHYPLLNKKMVTSIALDKNFNVWYGSSSDLSLSYWNDAKKQVTKFLKIDEKPLIDGVNFLYVDRKNRLWISTWAYTAYFKAPDQEIQKIPFSQDEPNSIAYGYFQDAIEDAEGNIWFATINGLSKNTDIAPLKAIYKLPSFNFVLDTGFAPINSIKIDQDMIVAAKDDGIIFYDMARRSFKRYRVTDQGDLLKNKFVSIAKIKENWWFAGYDGIYTLKNGDYAIKRRDLPKKINRSKYANLVFEDKAGYIWFHIIDDALYRYDPEKNKCQRFDGKEASYGLFEYNDCQSYIRLRSGNILFALEDSGFLQFDIHTEKFSTIPVRGLNDFFIPRMVEDNEGNIWAALFEKGILKFDLKGNKLDSLNTGNGLLFEGISSMNIDSRGLFWAAGSEGLFFFNPLRKEFTRVQIDFGKTLQDYYFDLTIANDKIYAAMLDHVVVIDPYKISNFSIKRPPNITSIKLFGKELTYYQNGKELDLAPDDDFLTFQFASLNHRDVPSIQYSYKLEGLESDWTYSGRLMTVSYNNLPRGHYTFLVRSTDEKGRWMRKVTSLRLHVHPYWWQTGWFITLMTILFVLLILGIYKSYLLRKQKLIFDKTVDYFANSVYGINSVNEICWDIARNCIAQLHFEDCVVYLFDKSKKLLIQKAAYGPKNPKGQEIINPIEIPLGKGIVGTVAATGKPLIIPDTSKDPRYILDDFQRFSELAVPILHEGKVIAVIDSEHSQKNYFKKEHQKVLSTIASISANKIAEALAMSQTIEKEIELLEINKLLAESQLMALRAQMNPHFVFNCLNSILECIATEKYGEASLYLNRFSKLFRTILNNSGKNLVTIEEEIAVLELYLKLEQMRFNGRFEYEIILSEDDLDPDEILVPSMLLQPYVENAVWHGLMHSTLPGKLIIEFRKVSDAIFECRIEDNGIGRAKSYELKKSDSKSRRHQSKGLQITEDRLKVLQRQGQHASVAFTDKYSNEGKPAGTLVVIELSTYLQNV